MANPVGAENRVTAPDQRFRQPASQSRLAGRPVGSLAVVASRTTPRPHVDHDLLELRGRLTTGTVVVVTTTHTRLPAPRHLQHRVARRGRRWGRVVVGESTSPGGSRRPSNSSSGDVAVWGLSYQALSTQRTARSLTP